MEHDSGIMGKHMCQFECNPCISKSDCPFYFGSLRLSTVNLTVRMHSD